MKILKIKTKTSIPSETYMATQCRRYQWQVLSRESSTAFLGTVVQMSSKKGLYLLYQSRKILCAEEGSSSDLSLISQTLSCKQMSTLIFGKHFQGRQQGEETWKKQHITACREFISARGRACGVDKHRMCVCGSSRDC